MTEHLSELQANAYLLGELSATQLPRVDAHLSSCETCTQYLETLRGVDAAAPVPEWLARMPAELREARPAPTPGVSTPERPNHRAVPRTSDERRPRARRRGRVIWGGAAVAVAAVAAVLLIVVPKPAPTPDDVVLRKGSDFALEVFATDGGAPREVSTGDAVAAGERLGFRVRSGRVGYLMIAGVDDKGSAYVCHPKSGPAQRLQPSSDATVLGSAVELDDVAGRERIVGLWCPDSFAFEDIVTTLQQGANAPVPLLREGCAQREVLLEKRVKPTP